MKDMENLLNDPHFNLLSFLITSARGCVDEPPIYGSLRLLDAARRVLDIMKNNEKFDKTFEELEIMIEDCIDVLMEDENEFIRRMDQISKKLGEIIREESI